MSGQFCCIFLSTSSVSSFVHGHHSKCAHSYSVLKTPLRANNNNEVIACVEISETMSFGDGDDRDEILQKHATRRLAIEEESAQKSRKVSAPLCRNRSARAFSTS